MDKRQEQQLHSLRSSYRFLSNPRYDLPRIVALRKRLGECIAEAERHNSQQTRASVHGRDGSSRRDALRSDLRQQLLRISQDGKALLHGMPGIKDELRVPHERDPDEDLIAAAARLLGFAKRQRRVFIQADFARDFIVRAERTAIALEEHITRPTSPVKPGPLATRNLRLALSKGRATIPALTGEIAATFGRNSSDMRAWRSASRIGKPIGRPTNRTRARREARAKEKAAKAALPS